MSDAERGMAVAWLQEGVGMREVGRRLQVTHSVMQRLRDRFNNTGSVLEPRNPPPPPNLNVLFQTLQQEWQAIPQNTLQTLVRSMRQRCLACINAIGRHTRY